MHWRPASSIILLSREVKEVLMLKRGQSAAFMPASYVFPGGVVELNDDGRFPEARTNWNYVNANPIKMEEHKNDYVYRIAALRELFEEAGILLTYNTNNRVSQLASSADDASLAEWRKKVYAEPSRFCELFSSAMQADVNALIPFSHWLTPNVYKRRYHTLFFVARIDPTHSQTQIEHCQIEMAHSEWMQPSDVLKRSSELGEISLPTPQYYELARLRIVPENALLDHSNPRRMTAQIIEAAEDATFRCAILPGDHLYNVANEETIGLRTMKKSEIVPSRKALAEHPIHRITYSMKPPYTKQQIYVANHEKMQTKMHIFYHSKSDAIERL